MESCIFCRILEGETPANIIYENELVIAFLSLEQPNPYKVLVIPRNHLETIYDLTDEISAAIFQATVKISKAVRDISKCEGLNIVQSNGKAGQQDVFHFHLHIVPRFFGDGITLDWDNTPEPQEKLSELATGIRSFLKLDD